MPDRPPTSLVAVDIGNSRIKAGWFDDIGSCEFEKAAELPIIAAGLPRPLDTITFGSHLLDEEQTGRALEDWLAAHPQLVDLPWVLSSVHRRRSELLAKVLQQLAGRSPRWLTCHDLAIPIRVNRPEQVGMDRLMGAVAANQLRSAHERVIVVDFGSAITIDLIAHDGGFEGGAILPGVAMGARALRAGTDALPESSLVELVEPPPVIGKSTMDAIDAGLYWGAVGAIRQIIETMIEVAGPAARVLLTGGAAPAVAARISMEGVEVHHVPHLILAGIAIAARSC